MVLLFDTVVVWSVWCIGALALFGVVYFWWKGQNVYHLEHERQRAMLRCGDYVWHTNSQGVYAEGKVTGFISGYDGEPSIWVDFEDDVLPIMVPLNSVCVSDRSRKE